MHSGNHFPRDYSFVCWSCVSNFHFSLENKEIKRIKKDTFGSTLSVKTLSAKISVGYNFRHLEKVFTDLI